MKSPFRADHVGSLLRPRTLLDARSNPATSPAALTRIEDEAILAVLDRQRAAGLEIFTDGEFRRAGFMSDFYESVDGLDRGGEIARTWKGAASTIGGTSGTVAGGAVGVAVEKITQTKPLTSRELGFLQQHAPGAIKMTLPSANQFPAIAYKKGISDRAYPTYSSFLWDIVPIIKAERSRGWRPPASGTSRSTRRDTATTSIRSGERTFVKRWGSIPSRRSTRRSAPTTPVLPASRATA